jgi:UDP-glucuronate 4-epimerase
MGFPRLSEKFIASELHRVEAAGVHVRLFVLKPAEERERGLRHPVIEAIAAEPRQLCRLYHTNHGVDAVALRFFSVYGPRQRPDMAFRRFCEAAVAGTPIEIYGGGRQTRDFTFVGDVVAAARAAAAADEVGGQVYNIGGGARASLAETLELLAGIAGRPLDVRRRERESGDVQDTGADIGRARAELGFAPATSLADGLRAEFEWVRERKHELGAVASAG